MPYLNVDLDYLTNKKTVRLIGLLGAQHAATPIRLWSYVGKHHCEDGVLRDYSKQEIEVFLNWKGKRGELVDALHRVGFLDCDVAGCRACESGTYRVHDWLEHAGHLAALKERGRRNAEKRWSRLAGKDATSIAETGAPSNAKTDATSIAAGNAPTSLPIPTIPSSLLNLPSPALGITAPPNRKCARHTREGPCQEYAVAGSQYCAKDREYYRSITARKTKELQADQARSPEGEGGFEPVGSLVKQVGL